MNKVTYWMRKLGMLRTSSYKVSGDAEKLNEVQANDGGMIQSQKEIDEKYKEENAQKKTENEQITQEPMNDNNQKISKKGSSSKVLFWIFTVIASLLCAMILTTGFSIWLVITVGLWAWFLRSVWSKTKVGSMMIGKTIAIGVALVIASLFFMEVALPSPEESREHYEEVISKMEQSEAEQKNEKTQSAEKEMDQISQFLTELKKDTEIDFGKITTDSNAKWTSTNIALIPTDAKVMVVKDTSNKDWSKIKDYFKDHDGHHGTIGFEFVDKSEDKQTGYLFDAGKYPHLMCVMTQTKETTNVSCGWGPGGGK